MERYVFRHHDVHSPITASTTDRNYCDDYDEDEYHVYYENPPKRYLRRRTSKRHPRHPHHKRHLHHLDPNDPRIRHRYKPDEKKIHYILTQRSEPCTPSANATQPPEPRPFHTVDSFRTTPLKDHALLLASPPHAPKPHFAKAVAKPSSPDQQVARVALSDRRHHWDRESSVCCECCPVKSSRAIPSMFYDQLRCPYCAARVQPTQNEVLLYPWTVQSIRPNRYGPSGLLEHDAVSAIHGSTVAERAPSVPRSGPQGSGVERSRVQGSGAQGPGAPAAPASRTHPPTTNASARFSLPTDDTRRLRPLSDFTAHTVRTHPVSEPKQGPKSLVTPPPPLEQHSATAVTQPYFRSGGIARGYKGTYVVQERPRPWPRVHEDEVGPDDSISNVQLPALRAEADEAILTERKASKAVSDVDRSYPREKFFQSLPVSAPRLAPSTPGPIPRSKQSRSFHGEYVDRGNGQKYRYNVDYGKRSVNSDRRPNG